MLTECQYIMFYIIVLAEHLELLPCLTAEQIFVQYSALFFNHRVPPRARASCVTAHSKGVTLGGGCHCGAGALSPSPAGTWQR